MYNAYDLTRDDADAIISELSNWPATSEDTMKHVDTKTKAALTRAYNKTSHSLPYELAPEEMAKGLSRRGAKKRSAAISASVCVVCVSSRKIPLLRTHPCSMRKAIRS